MRGLITRCLARFKAYADLSRPVLSVVYLLGGWSDMDSQVRLR